MADQKTDKQTVTGPGAALNLASAPTARTFLARFYANDTTSPRAPIARAEIQSKDFPGFVITSEIYAERDQRGNVTGFRASLPGSGKYGAAVHAEPVFVTGQDGREYPVKDTKCPAGAALEKRWNGVIVAGWLSATDKATTDNPIPTPVQSLTF